MSQVEILAWREHQKNSMQGYVDIRLPKAGFCLRNISVHMKDGRRWLGMPSRKDESDQWVPIFEWNDKQVVERFRDAVLKALDAFAKNPQMQYDDDAPF